ncbi:MAG: AMP-binding protein [Actinomycetota bacterium]
MGQPAGVESVLVPPAAPRPVVARSRPRPASRTNLSEALLDDRLDAWGDVPAIREPGGTTSVAALAAATGAVAGALVAAGVSQRDVVAIALPDSALWCTAFLAVARIGAVVAPVSLALPADRRRDGVERSGARLVLTDDPDLAAGRACLGTADLREAIAAEAPDPGVAATRADDPCYMLMTSGSTGPSKWAVHRHGDIPACIATYGRRVIRLCPGDVTYSVARLATSYGLGNSLYFPVGAGAAAWIDGQDPTPAGLAWACREGGVTAVFGVPTFWARLARHAAEGRVDVEDLAPVRLGVSAGEPLPEAVWREVRDATGIRLVDGLGSSEATNLYLSNRRGEPLPGTVGWVVPGYALRVVDPAGRDLPDGEAGELLVRGPTVMQGYLGDPAASASALDGGWLRTGDLVRREAGGRFAFVGRTGDRFKAGGLWVDPARVEGDLRSDPEVAEVAVTGAPDAQGVLRVVAVVVLAPADGDAEAARRRMLARAEGRLARHEVPRAVVVVPALPTTPTGKVRRGEVAALARAALAGAS